MIELSPLLLQPLDEAIRVQHREVLGLLSDRDLFLASGAKVSSFYLEMRAAQRMASETSFIPYLDFAYLIRNLVNNGLADMNDLTGVAGRFRATSTENYRSAAVAMFAVDAKRVADAVELEKSGNRSEVFSKLAYVFVSTTFPAQFYWHAFGR